MPTFLSSFFNRGIFKDQNVFNSAPIQFGQPVGTAAGDIGHAGGAVLVAAPGTGKILELMA